MLAHLFVLVNVKGGLSLCKSVPYQSDDCPIDGRPPGGISDHRETPPEPTFHPDRPPVSGMSYALLAVTLPFTNGGNDAESLGLSRKVRREASRWAGERA